MHKSKRKRMLRAMASCPKTLTLQATATVDVAAAADGKPAKRPSFTINAYNGEPMIVAGFFRPVVIDLRGLRAGATVPILLDHDPRQIVGQANEIKIGRDSIRLSGVITGEDEPAQKVTTHARNGFVWAASVGVPIDKLDPVGEGVNVKVNGKQFSGPLYIVRSGRLAETSLLAVGANEGADAAVAARAALGKEFLMFEEWLKANGWEADKLTDKQKAKLQAAFAAEQAEEEDETPETRPKTKPKKKLIAAGATEDADGTDAEDDDQDDLVQTMRAAAAAESKRIAGIRKLCAGKHAELEAKAIAEGWTSERAELEVLRAEAPRVNTSRSGGGEQLNARALEASLLLSYGLAKEANVTKWYGDKVMEQATSKDLRGAGVHDLLFFVIRAAGKHVALRRVDNDTIRAAFEADRMLRAAGGASTISLPGILGNLANKAMLERFEQLESVVPLIAYETDTNDFKQFKRFRLDSDGSFKEVTPAGELKHISLVESEIANQLKTFGGIIALTRPMMIDDDLGAFAQLPQIFGELALHCREQKVFEAVLGNTGNFFSAGNGNYFEGADSALSIASLNVARKMFREQKNKGGKFILQSPTQLFVPPSLESDANRLYTSDTVNETTTANKPAPVNNPHKGLFKPAVSPYLGTASGLTGASDVHWYLGTRPTAGSAMVQVGYLRGQRTPVVESGEADFDTLGVKLRSYYDFGVALHEQRAAVRSKGQA